MKKNNNSNSRCTVTKKVYKKCKKTDVVGTVTSTFQDRSSLMSTYTDFSTFVVND